VLVDVSISPSSTSFNLLQLPFAYWYYWWHYSVTTGTTGTTGDYWYYRHFWLQNLAIADFTSHRFGAACASLCLRNAFSVGHAGVHRVHAALSAESCLSGPCSTMVPNSSSVFLPAERALPRFVLPVGQVEVERLLRVATSCRHRHHEQGGPTDATGLTPYGIERIDQPA